MSQPITITIPVKPYIKRFIEINYGLPADLSSSGELVKMVKRCLRKPNKRWDHKLCDKTRVLYETVEIIISEDTFYRYGWEISKTDTVALGKEFERRVKVFMRNIVGVNYALGLPINTSILRFQEKFSFPEDVWSYESIKKDFYRNGSYMKIDFENEIFNKINHIIMENLSGIGTLSQKALSYYEVH